MQQRIPDATIRRLPAYLRWLSTCNLERVTSGILGQATGFSSEQIRKDLAYFGAFGTRGVGYEVKALRQEILHILQLDHGVRAVVIGAGHLGTALVRYVGQLHQRDVDIVAMVDNNPDVIGTKVGTVRVESVDQLERLVDDYDIGIAVLTLPASAAVEVAERLADAGVHAFLNFAPVPVCSKRPDVFVQQIDLTLEMQALSYFVQSRQPHHVK
ncbi:MAG: redox-sensing transcriptional repressor Rex [Sulfobacillus sp.]